MGHKSNPTNWERDQQGKNRLSDYLFIGKGRVTVRYLVIENQTHRLQYEVEADSEEEAVQKWIESRGEGFEFKDLDDYLVDYEVESQGK